MFWKVLILSSNLNTNFVFFFEGNRESYCCLYYARQVNRNMDSNYDPINGPKIGSPTFCSLIWLPNIFLISQGQSSQNQV